MSDSTPIWIGGSVIVVLWLLSRSGSALGATAQQRLFQQQQLANLNARRNAVDTQQSQFGSLLGGLIRGLTNPQKAQQPQSGAGGSRSASPGGGSGGSSTSSRGSPCPNQDPATENIIQVCPCANPSVIPTWISGAAPACPCPSPVCPGTGVVGGIPGVNPCPDLTNLTQPCPTPAPVFCPGPAATVPCANMPCPGWSGGGGGIGCVDATFSEF